MSIMLTISLAGCGILGGFGTAKQETSSDIEAAVNTEEGSSALAEAATEAPSDGTLNELFTERDLSGEYEASSSVNITLNGKSAETDAASGVSVSEGRITIDKAGTYILSGDYEGMIFVNAGDQDKVQLVLDGADITNNDSAVIYVLSADKVFVTLAEGSENTLSHSGEYTSYDDNNIDGVIFSKSDLTLNGTGSLTVTDDTGNAIVSKDDLRIASGSLILNVGKHGLEGKDSVRIAGGSIDVTGSHEGIEGCEITILGGDITISAEDDGINASGDGDCAILIAGGTLRITAKGDGIDTNGTLTVSGGEIFVSGSENNGNGALDYQTTAVITGGTIIAVGASGMAENFGTDSTQGAILVSTASMHEAGENVTLLDESGNELLSYTAKIRFNSILVSHPSITEGKTYTVKAGDEVLEVTMDSLIYGSGMGGFGGGREGFGERPEGFGEKPEGFGEKPEGFGEKPEGFDPSQLPEGFEPEGGMQGHGGKQRKDTVQSDENEESEDF